jgi:NTE family protein
MSMHYRRPTIGLALGGGGARGLAHIGVLKVFERERIHISCLSGTSMGGVVAAAYAAGVPLDQLALEAARLGNLTRMLELIDRKFHLFSGLFSNSGIQKYLSRLLGEHTTFETLCIPLALSAVDNRTGREVVLQSGNLLQAVNATMALPGAVAPVIIGDMLLSDGGTLNNVPADLVRSMGAEMVIAVNVSPAVKDMFHDTRFIPAAATAIWRANNIANSAITLAKLRKANPDLLICPELRPSITTLTGFKYASEVITAGERAALQSLNELRRMHQPLISAPPCQLQKSVAYEI